MALDSEYFDGISIDLVKKKYYNAGKVNALLEDIRARAQGLLEENQSLRQELEELRCSRDDIGEVLLAAQTQARQILARARDEADRIVRDAESRAGSNSLDAQEHAARCVERCFEMLRRQQRENADALNGLWQDFLCGLQPEELQEDGEDEPDVEDIEHKVTVIASELRKINGKEQK